MKQIGFVAYLDGLLAWLEFRASGWLIVLSLLQNPELGSSRFSLITNSAYLHS